MGRRLGQHFLSDPAILDRIVAALDPTISDTVIEIGPGRGSLTRRLAATVGHVVAIEADSVLVQKLRTQGSFPNVTVAEGDALEVDWHSLLEDPAGPFKVIGNIPYYITSPLIDKALTAPEPEVIVMLMQQEVADRLTASPGGKTYGALSVGVQTVAAVERLFTVKPGSFQPPPNVNSAVVRIVPSANPLLGRSEREEFRRFVTAMFSQRRKQLTRSLRSVTGETRERVETTVCDLELDPTQRAEVATPADFVRLFRAFGSLADTSESI